MKTTPTERKMAHHNKREHWFGKLLECIGWLWIVASPTLIGIFFGVWYYLSSPNTSGLIGGTSTVVLGLLIGIIWANKVKKKHGTLWFISSVAAAHDISEDDKNTYKAE